MAVAEPEKSHVTYVLTLPEMFLWIMHYDSYCVKCVYDDMIHNIILGSPYIFLFAEHCFLSSPDSLFWFL